MEYCTVILDAITTGKTALRGTAALVSVLCLQKDFFYEEDRR